MKIVIGTVESISRQTSAMSKSIKVLKYFGKIEGGQVFDEEQFRALKHGDMILVQLDGEQPEIRKFTGFRVRAPLIATLYKGYDYSYFFVDGSHPKNPQTKHHRYSVDRSRFRGLAPAQ